MKKDTNKKRKPINGWKLTAILSLIVNGIVALLLTIGLAQPKASVKVSAYNEVYDTSKIVLTTGNINRNINYYLYYDWVNQSVEGSDILYYFPICNDVPNFEYWRALPSNLIYEDNDYYLNVLFIRKTQNRNTIEFTYYGTDKQTQLNGVFRVAEVKIQIEPRSMYLDFDTEGVDISSNAIRTHFKSLFNGSNLSIASDAPSFIIGYFSQYSVQNLEVGLRTDSNIALNHTDFSPYSFGVYGMGGINDVSYTYLQSSLIHSDARLVSEGDLAYMPLLNGSFYAKEQYSAVLVGVWKEIYWPQFDTASTTPVYYDVLFNGQKLNKSNGYYYYLESINFYNVGAEELGEVIYSVTNIDYAQEFQWSNGYCYYTTKLQASVLNPVVIRKVNLYPSQRVEWINFSNIFNITNHFYFGNGIIDNPSIGNDNNINGGNTAIGNVFVLIKNGFESVMPLLGLMILPNITIGMLLFLPLIGAIIIVIIKLVKR